MSMERHIAAALHPENCDLSMGKIIAALAKQTGYGTVPMYSHYKRGEFVGTPGNIDGSFMHTAEIAAEWGDDIIHACDPFDLQMAAALFQQVSDVLTERFVEMIKPKLPPPPPTPFQGATRAIDVSEAPKAEPWSKLRIPGRRDLNGEI